VDLTPILAKIENSRGQNRLGTARTGRTGPAAGQETPETINATAVSADCGICFSLKDTGVFPFPKTNLFNPRNLRNLRISLWPTS